MPRSRYFFTAGSARQLGATAAAVLALFGAALLSKEHTIVLPALLLLTDYWWNPGFSFKGIRANWKLYAPMARRRPGRRRRVLEPDHAGHAPRDSA